MHLPDARDMFWLIIDEEAYGGRYGLLPLLKEVVRGMLYNKGYSNNIHYIRCNECSSCSLFTRIRSLFTNGRKIKI